MMRTRASKATKPSENEASARPPSPGAARHPLPPAGGGRGLQRLKLLVGTVFLLALVFADPAQAAELPEPTGPVVLTIAGAIGKTNRPAFDEFEDGFLGYHEKTFEKAAAFDRAMLEGLGVQAVTLGVPAWPKAIRFEGPWLKDLLDAVEARGETITIFALDGYGVEITHAELESHDWLVALKRDGRPLNIGQRGPTWVVYDRKDGQAPSHDDEARWAWSVFYIEVSE